MKKYLLALTLLSIVMSCKKSKDPNTEDNESFKGCAVESVTIKDQDNDKRWNYIYDDKGRVIKETYSSSPRIGTQNQGFENYEYLEKRINISGEEVTYGGRVSLDGYCELDDKKRIIKRLEENGDIDWLITYNIDGYITYTDDGDAYTYLDGNLVRKEGKILNQKTTIDFIYSNELLPNSEFDTKFFKSNLPTSLSQYLGKNSKNLISKITETVIWDNDYTTSATTTYNYSFKKDSKNNIISMTEVKSTPHYTGETTTNDTYKCF